jgi:hypothetical protein
MAKEYVPVVAVLEAEALKALVSDDVALNPCKLVFILCTAVCKPETRPCIVPSEDILV